MQIFYLSGHPRLNRARACNRGLNVRAPIGSRIKPTRSNRVRIQVISSPQSPVVTRRNFPAFLGKILKKHYLNATPIAGSLEPERSPNSSREMSTWHLFSDADHNFRWEKAGRTIPTKPKPDHNLNGVPNQPHNAVTPLPSMADLLSHGISSFRQ